MTYKLKIGCSEFEEKNKDEVISRLISILTLSNEINVKVTFPDGSYILDESCGEDGWEE